MATIAVTGGAGFIGSNLVDALLDRGDHVIAIDNFNDFYDPDIKRRNISGFTTNDNFTLVQADICDQEIMHSTFSVHQPDAIVHLAAWAGVRPSLEQPTTYVRNNVEGTVTLLEAARTLPGVRFVMASSSSVYGGLNEVPFKESMDVDRPISPYAATKRACEIFAQTFHTLYGMDIWAIRLFTCYGPRQRPDLAIHKFTRLIEAGEPLPMFGDGSATRDYLYVDDCVKGLMAAADRCKGFEIINLGESHTVRLDELIRLISEALGKPAKIARENDQPGDVPRTYADLTKAAALLDYAPGTMIEEGIKRFVDWYRSL